MGVDTGGGGKGALVLGDGKKAEEKGDGKKAPRTVGVHAF